MNIENIDPFFKPRETLLGFSGVDARFFLLSDEDFWNRYHFDMSTYGLGDNTPCWRSGRNIPKCSSCRVTIEDSSRLRRHYGINFCPECFSIEMQKEYDSSDKRKRLDVNFAYFLRVAGILDQVPARRLNVFMQECREEVKKYMMHG